MRANQNEDTEMVATMTLFDVWCLDSRPACPSRLLKALGVALPTWCRWHRPGFCSKLLLTLSDTRHIAAAQLFEP